MANRRYFRQQGERSDQEYGRHDRWQPKQFEQRGRYDDDRYSQMGEHYESGSWEQTGADYPERDYRPAGRAYRGSFRGQARQQEDRSNRPSHLNPAFTSPYSGSPYGGGYGRSPYRDSSAPPYGDFTSNDIGGGDFSGAQQRFGYYGAGVATGPGYGAAPRNSYGADEERGFFERAGDEIASWFGDEEAARRREMDHTGYGPTNYTRSDERILEDVCDRITRDWAVDGRGVQVSVQGGDVTLDGTVPSRQQKRRAEDCADDIAGVGHVQNNLRVQQRSAETA